MAREQPEVLRDVGAKGLQPRLPLGQARKASPGASCKCMESLSTGFWGVFPLFQQT